MPIFMMIFGFISIPISAILDKPIISGIALLVGLVADAIFWIILEITDDKPDSGFAIDWGA